MDGPIGDTTLKNVSYTIHQGCVGQKLFKTINNSKTVHPTEKLQEGLFAKKCHKI